MKWQELTHDFNGKRARVSAKSTISHPYTGESFDGRLHIPKPGAVTLLVTDDHRPHWFSGWWDVEILNPDIRREEETWKTLI